MEYKSEILKLVNRVNNDALLEIIYHFLKGFLH